LACDDNFYNKDSTCGFQYDNQGSKIFDSQGYCCACSFSQIVGIDKTKFTRGKICETLNLGEG